MEILGWQPFLDQFIDSKIKLYNAYFIELF